MTRTIVLFGSDHTHCNYPYIMDAFPGLNNQYHIDAMSLELDFSSSWLYPFLYFPAKYIDKSMIRNTDGNEYIAAVHYARLEDLAGNHIPVHLTDKPELWRNRDDERERRMNMAVETDIIKDYDLISPEKAEPEMRKIYRWTISERNSFTVEVWKRLFDTKGYSTLAHFGGMAHYEPEEGTTLQELIAPYVDRIVFIDNIKRKERALC